MSLLSLFFLALALSVDSAAVAVSIGICHGQVRLHQALKVGLVFALAQVLTPLAGYLAGQSLQLRLSRYDHWLAFILLTLVGVKMIYDNLHEQDLPDDQLEQKCPANLLSLPRLLLLGLATSIDALAAGISLAMTGSELVPALLLIGLTTLLIAAGGMLVGNQLSFIFQSRACILGGLVLILLGGRIMLRHYTGF